MPGSAGCLRTRDSAQALLSAFVVFAVLLAAIGLYGELRQFVVQRTPEIAGPHGDGRTGRSDVLRLIARQAGAPLVTGLAVGLAGASGLSRPIASILYGVQAHKPATFSAVSLVLIAAGATAAFFPGAPRRLSRPNDRSAE